MTALRVSHLSDDRQRAIAINRALKRTDAIDLTADQLTVTIDRAMSVTGDVAATGNISGVAGTLTGDLAVVNVDASGVYKKGGTQVVGARKTGWATATGTPTRTTFATYAGQTVSNPPTQTEVQNIDNHVKILSERLKALIDDLHATAGHGLIGT